jgi:UDP-N-acetylglucosamine:LPS N-acetylglucosamine transferase
MPKRAVILTGSLGLGHDVIADVVAGTLAGFGWDSRTLDCMTMLGKRSSRAGQWMYRRLTAMPGAYDGLHFAHFRTGSRLSRAMDRSATSRLVPALRTEFQREPADLVIAVFATGASAISQLTWSGARPPTAVLCTDAVPYSFWVGPGINLFLVTSGAAAASVRRYRPRARVCVVPPPVRAAFYYPPAQAAARGSLGVPADAPTALLMGGGWGLGPLADSARALADAGVHVLAVAGRNERLASRLAAIARDSPRVHPFGFTDRMPELMAACDIVVSLPGATTCSEARVVGRRLMLLDVMPGHGRENVQHELELGDADVSGQRPADLTASVLTALDRVQRPLPAGIRPAGEWDRAFTTALACIGVEPAARLPEAAGDPAGPGSPLPAHAPQEAFRP